jgi:hypothetical protein
MPICGYHPKMGVSVRELAEGLALSLRSKADRLNLSHFQQMEEEAVELQSLRELLATRYKSASLEQERRILEGWIGLVNLVRFLMQPQESRHSTRIEFETALLERAEVFNESMIRFENTFEANLDVPVNERLILALSSATG